jgi:hypothetical protein
MNSSFALFAAFARLLNGSGGEVIAKQPGFHALQLGTFTLDAGGSRLITVEFIVTQLA